MAFLAAKSLDLADRHAFDAETGQGFTNLVELGWFNHRKDKFNSGFSPKYRLPGPRRRLHVIAAFAMGGDIEPFGFVLDADPQTHGLFDDLENDIADDGGPNYGNQNAGDLGP